MLPLLRSLPGALARHRRLLLSLLFLAILESALHVRRFHVVRPPKPLDAPFHTGCQVPKVDAPRANATILMLARNSDLEGALHSIRSIEEQFNKWFHYPMVFLNNEAWESKFVDAIKGVASGEVRFEVIGEEMWGYPGSVDRTRARREMDRMQGQGVMYAGEESYHHMCRFNSGMFYDHPALKPYKWYWRVEPHVSFTCTITYDPFVEMEKNKKRYGYTIALWELGQSVPSLFRKVSDYKNQHHLATSSVWTAMMDPSYIPWPFRRLGSWGRNRDANGDWWNMCHFWSNFEIADMDFFRGENYRRLFEFLDADGGFYYERWGDAPVHSLAAALFLQPEEIHHFADLGYVHETFQYCPFTSPDGWIPDAKLTPIDHWRDAEKGAMGCNCVCNTSISIVGPVCLNKIKSTVF